MSILQLVFLIFVKCACAQEFFSLFLWAEARGVTYRGANGDFEIQLWEGDPFKIGLERKIGKYPDPSHGYNVFPSAPNIYGGNLTNSNIRAYYGETDVIDVTKFGKLTPDFLRILPEAQPIQSINGNWNSSEINSNYSIFWPRGMSLVHFGERRYGMWCSFDNGKTGQCFRLFVLRMFKFLIYKYRVSSKFNIKTQTILQNLFVANQLELNVRIQNVQDEFQIKTVDIFKTNDKFLNRKVFNISTDEQRIWARCSVPCQDWNSRFANANLKLYVDDIKFDLINKNVIEEERCTSTYNINQGILQFGGFETISIAVSFHPCVSVFKIKCEAWFDEWRVLPMCNTPRGYESVLQGRLCQPNNGIASGLIEFHQSNFSECVMDTTPTTTSVIFYSGSHIIENDDDDFNYLLTIIISDLIVAIILLVIGYLIITLIIKIKRIRSRVNDGYFHLQSFV